MYYEWDRYRPTDDDGRPVPSPFRVSRMTAIPEYEARNLTRQMEVLTEMNSGYKRSIQEYMSAQNIRLPTDYRSIDSKRSIRYLRQIPDGALQSMIDIMEQTAEWEKNIEDELRTMLQNDENVNLLMTIPGIDFRLASYFAMHIRDVTDFDHPDSLVCYFGLEPRVRSSARKAKNGQPIVKDSSSKLRRRVYDAVRTHVRCCRNSEISRFHLRMMYKIGIRKAEAAAGRKLVTVMWAMLTHREPFSPHPRR
jgi:transposase